MAAVYKIVFPSGREVVRVAIRTKEKRRFCVQFEDWDEAWAWVDSNEKKFHLNPQHYYTWRENRSLSKRKARFS